MKTHVITVMILLSGLLVYRPGALFAQHDHSAHTQSSAAQESPAEPAQGAEEEEAPTVEIETELQQLIGVKVTEAAVKPLQRTIRTIGRIESDERKTATVNTKFEGWIEKLYVNYTGRPVKKGEPLAELYSPELYATQLEYLNLLKWTGPAGNQRSEVGSMLSKDAETLLDAAAQRLKLWDITDEQVRKIRETGTPFRTLAIYSPLDGYVTEKMAIEGMRVMPGEKLFDIADLSSLWVLADIYEFELPYVRAGQKARITMSNMPGKEIEAVIDYVYPSIAGATRTATARFQIPSFGGQLKPRMFADIEISVDLGRKLVIPDNAIIDTGTRQIVYVDRGEGFFEPREIRAGAKAGGSTEVIAGLSAGEKVASSATFLIDSEAQLKGITPLKK